MIRIISQDALHQYDSEGRAITTWDAKKCAWIVNHEFEGTEIDWYGRDSDFPAGCTLKQWEQENPDHANNPHLQVTWYYNTIQALVITFGEKAYWEKNAKVFPYVVTRQWDYMSKKDYPDFLSAANGLCSYAGFHKGADKVVFQYNNEASEMILKKVEGRPIADRWVKKEEVSV